MVPFGPTWHSPLLSGRYSTFIFARIWDLSPSLMAWRHTPSPKFLIRVCGLVKAVRRLNTCQTQRSVVPTFALSRSFANPVHRMTGVKRAFVALGSNVGDRLHMIEQACKLMDSIGGIKLLRTSSLYETRPMYYENQDHFLNGACEVRQMACCCIEVRTISDT